MRYFFFWVPPIVWMGFIFYFSSQQSLRVSDDYAVQFLIFKTLHLIEYGMLYILLYRSLRNTKKAPDWQHRYDAWLVAVMYAILDEIHQVFVPTREGRMRDIAIDAIGVTLAALVLWKFLPTAPKRLKSWVKKLQLI